MFKVGDRVEVKGTAPWIDLDWVKNYKIRRNAGLREEIPTEWQKGTLIYIKNEWYTVKLDNGGKFYSCNKDLIKLLSDW